MRILVPVLAGLMALAPLSARAQGFDARASSDLRNLATAEEAYFAANAAYTSNLQDLTGFRKSPGVTVAVDGITASSFTATASHGSGDRTFRWDSANGGLQSTP